jgi:AcrR family transcriptional regulator
MSDERRRLTRAQVLSEALDLIDQEGLDALTMRTLADRLDVVPMALYRHVRNKDDLMEGLLDQAVSRVDLPDAALDWRDGLTGLARSIRGTMLRHPALAARVIDRPSLGPASLVIGEYGLGVLRRAGFSDDVAEHGLNAVLVYTLGFVALEVPRLPGTAGHDTLAGLGSDSTLESLAPEDFPHTLAVRPEPGRIVGEEQFAFGLECILDGIGRRGGHVTAPPS